MDGSKCVQKNLPKKITAKDFLLGVAGVVLTLAICQVVVNLLIRASGIGLLNLLFYAFSVILMLVVLRRTVAGTTYALDDKTLVFQCLLGDSTTSVIEIPLESVRGIYPVRRGEKLSVAYAQATYIDRACRPGARFALAFAMSYVSAFFARAIMGKKIDELRGWVVAFNEGGKMRACVFRPNEAFRAALAERMPQVYELDERTRRDALIRTTAARAMHRVCPELYPYVEPLVSEEEIEVAKRSIEEDNRQRKALRGEKARVKRKAKAAQPRKPKDGEEKKDEPQTTPNRRRRKKNEVHDDTV